MQQRGGQLLARVRALRGNLAQQLGFIVPPVHITDNVRLKPHEYVISLRGVEIARWEMHPEKLLAISSDATPPPLAGMPDPRAGLRRRGPVDRRRPCKARPWPRAMRWSIRLRCWPRISPNSSSSTPPNC